VRANRNAVKIAENLATLIGALERRHNGEAVSSEELAEKGADVLIALDRLLLLFDTDLGAATVARFDAVSKQWHADVFLGGAVDER